MESLQNKVAVVTGASSGFGRGGTAIALAEAGVNLVLAARREAKLAKVVARCQKLGGQGGLLFRRCSKRTNGKDGH